MRLRSFLALALLACAIVIACAPAGFAPSTALESVRILATRADFDKSYARPGDTVTLETLAVDARPIQSTPMTLYWFPFGCENPANDLYTSCFTPGQVEAGIIPEADGSVNAGADADANANANADAEAGADAVANANAVTPQAASNPFGSLLQPGTDLTPFLPTGPRFSFTVPDDIITRHPVVPGAPDPYGLVIVFNVACAGHVEVTPANPSTGAQQVPLGCFDANGNQLGPDDYVIGFSRVYVHANLPNANPAINGVIVNGVEIPAVPDPTRPPGDAHDVPAPIDVDLNACTSSNCSSATIDMDVPQSSWELDPSNKDADGNIRHETLWVDFFAEGGSLDDSAELLYDSIAGQITGHPQHYTPPAEPGEATIYAVVHDNRDGVTWIKMNVHVH